MSPGKGNKAGERAGRHVRRGAAKDLREKEAEGPPHCSLQLPEEGRRRWKC